MLAASSIGAIWSSTSPDFGVTVSQTKLDKRRFKTGLELFSLFLSVMAGIYKY